MAKRGKLKTGKRKHQLKFKIMGIFDKIIFLEGLTKYQQGDYSEAVNYLLKPLMDNLLIRIIR
jgi:hypothetical protein